MRLLQICLMLLVVHEARAQQSRPAGDPGKTTAALTRTSFSTSGLHHEKTLTSLYLGDFVNINFDRENLPFLMLFEQYLEAYARHCSTYLPANKVEMTRSVCAREQYSVNQYGARVGGSTCVEYRTEGMGLYADPTMYAAKSKLDDVAAVSVLKDSLRMMTQKNPLEAALNTVNDAQQMTDDMNALFRLNSCVSPGLKRFQENLLLFSLGKQPIPLAGAAPSVTGRSQPSPAAPFKDANYTRLLEDLISEQAKTWLMNRFVSGSTSNVVVSSRDAAGRPAKVIGRYLFNGRSQGSVTVDFSDGLPECMYFFDLPSTCKTPNRRVVAAYSSGSYQQ